MEGTYWSEWGAWGDGDLFPTMSRFDGDGAKTAKYRSGQQEPPEVEGEGDRFCGVIGDKRAGLGRGASNPGAADVAACRGDEAVAHALGADAFAADAVLARAVGGIVRRAARRDIAGRISLPFRGVQ